MSIERSKSRPASTPASSAEAPAAAASPSAAAGAAQAAAPAAEADRFAASATRPAAGQATQQSALEAFTQAREGRASKKSAPAAADPSSPVPRSSAEHGVQHVAQLLKDAAGKDGVVSKADASSLLASLKATGRTTEAGAADLFLRFLQNREPSKTSRVTAKDVDAGAAYALEHLLLNKDKNANGFEPAEIAKLSATGKAMLETGRLLDAGSIPADTPGKKAADLAAQLEKQAGGLLFTSESDYPFKAFSKPLGKDVPFTNENFNKALGKPAGTPLDVRSLDDWFNETTSPDTGIDPDTAAKFRALQDAMHQGLTDLKLVYFGPENVVDAPVYLVGRTPEGDLAGLQSRRIWT